MSPRSAEDLAIAIAEADQHLDAAAAFLQAALVVIQQETKDRPFLSGRNVADLAGSLRVAVEQHAAARQHLRGP